MTKLEPQLPTKPSEAELLHMALLIRLYDVGMGILRELNPQYAQDLFDTHNEGKDYNPVLFLPEMKQVED